MLRQGFTSSLRRALLFSLVPVVAVGQTSEENQVALYKSAMVQLEIIKTSKHWDKNAEAKVKRLITSQKEIFEAFQTLSTLSHEMRVNANETSGYLTAI